MSKVSKSRISRLSRKSRTQKNKTQKGGSSVVANSVQAISMSCNASPDEKYKNTIIWLKSHYRYTNSLTSQYKYSNIVQAYSNIVQALQNVFEKLDMDGNKSYPNFELDKSTQGPLIDMQNNTGFMSYEPATTETSYLEWYKQYNGDFKTINKLNSEGNPLRFYVKIKGIDVPIYENVIAHICRDICIMILTGKRNIDNQYRTKNSRLKEKQRLTILRDLEHKKKHNMVSSKFRTSENESNNEFLQSIISNCEERINKFDSNINLLDDFNKNNNLQKNLVKLANNSVSIRTKLLDLLEECETCIKDEYKYINVLKIFIKYIDIISSNDFTKIFLPNALNSPYIFYPTYSQISFKSVVLLCTAPIINFRISNRKRLIHNSYSSQDIHHDILIHSRFSHGFGMDIENYEERFNTINDLIKLFYSDFANQNEESGKFVAFLLFAFIHEDVFHFSLKNILSGNLNNKSIIEILSILNATAGENKFYEFMKPKSKNAPITISNINELLDKPESELLQITTSQLSIYLDTLYKYLKSLKDEEKVLPQNQNYEDLIKHLYTIYFLKYLLEFNRKITENKKTYKTLLTYL